MLCKEYLRHFICLLFIIADFSASCYGSQGTRQPPATSSFSANLWGCATGESELLETPDCRCALIVVGRTQADGATGDNKTLIPSSPPAQTHPPELFGSDLALIGVPRGYYKNTKFFNGGFVVTVYLQ
jgi:hypothetical protein